MTDTNIEPGLMNRSLLLDVSRIFAILLVFAAHFGQLFDSSAGSFFGLKNFYYVSLGGVGVSLFLVLSGLLAGLGKSPGLTGYGSFLLKKILRIYPLYWISVLLAFAGYMLGGWLMENDFPKAFPNGLSTDLIGSLTGFYSWFGLWGGPYNSPSWFIALIMVMYALFPPLYFFMNKQPHLVLGVLLVISLVSRWYVGQEGLPFSDSSLFTEIKGWFYRQYGFMPGRPGDWFPPCRVFEFGLGVYLALILPKSTWFKLQFKYNRPLVVLSDLAFPLFLIHYPYLFVVIYLHQLGLPVYVAIGLFMILLFALAYWANTVDERVPRKKIMSVFAGH